MKRNPEATCATCPYWCELSLEEESKIRQSLPYELKLQFPVGRCQSASPNIGYFGGVGMGISPVLPRDGWCGQHPDFELKIASP